MENSLKIEKNIPVAQRQHGKKKKYDFPFAKMEVGDSFYYEEAGFDKIKICQTLNIYSNLFSKKNNLNWKFSVRVEKNGARIWRTV